jgi:hypothetical protein
MRQLLLYLSEPLPDQHTALRGTLRHYPKGEN